MIRLGDISKTIEALIDSKAWKAVFYASPTEIVRVTRRWYGRKGPDKNKIELQVTAGKPNYLEREFIKKCKKAGEPFPVKKVQLKFRVHRAKKK